MSDARSEPTGRLILGAIERRARGQRHASGPAVVDVCVAFVPCARVLPRCSHREVGVAIAVHVAHAGDYEAEAALGLILGVVERDARRVGRDGRSAMETNAFPSYGAPALRLGVPTTTSA